MLLRSNLHDYQQTIISHIQDHERSAAFAYMGTGKTCSTLTALDDLSMVEDVWPVLVLAPLRVARSVWGPETQDWEHLSHLTVSVICGDVLERKAALKRKAHIYTCNYDQLVWLCDTLGDDWPFRVVVADEASKLKSHRLRQGGKRTAALATVAHSKVNRFINLTGTPSPNGLLDLWGQTWFLDKGERLGRTFSAFEQRWFAKGYDGFSLKPLPHAQGEIQDRLKDICLTVEGLKVDEPIFNTIGVDLPPQARRLYDQMEKEMFAEIAGHGVEAFNAAARTSKVQQIASGACIVNSDTGAWEAVHDAKLDALESVIEEASGAPVLVAYTFKSDLARLRKRFPKGVVLDADPKTIKRWNAGDIPIMFGHPASAGHGLNLARGGNILCFFSRDWNLETYLQIIERLGPMRQKQAGLNRPVFVHFIVAKNTVDELIGERLVSKRSVQDVLLAALRRRV